MMVTTNDTNPTRVRFIVKSSHPRSSTVKILLMWPVTTYQAYNHTTLESQKCLYPSIPGPHPTYNIRSHVVSFDRPYYGENYFTGDGEVKFLLWLKDHDIHTDSCTSIDIHENATILDDYYLLVSFGHDEYWSKEMRDHVEDFIGKGGNVAFFSGNTCWWQVRFEDDSRKMICYKSAIDDPLTGIDNQRVTINWAASPVNRPENSMTGVSYRNGAQLFDDGWKKAKAKYRVRAASHWVFEDTGLNDNDYFGEGIVGNETDAALFDEIDVLRAPVVTGKDGTPRSFRILASADLGDWRSNGQGGKVTMGIYTNWGTVFTAATIKWCTGLDDRVISKITYNVLTKLSKPIKRWKTDVPSEPVIQNPIWKKIGLAKNVVTMTGHVEGHLFATTSTNDLLRRDPVVNDLPWERIGDANNVIAMATAFEGNTRLIQPPRMIIYYYEILFVTPRGILISNILTML